MIVIPSGLILIFGLNFAMQGPTPPASSDGVSVYSVSEKSGRSFVTFKWTTQQDMVFLEDTPKACSSLVLEGQVRKRGEVIDTFRLEFAPGSSADPINLVFERALTRGPHQLHVELLSCEKRAIMARTLDFTITGKISPPGSGAFVLVKPLQANGVHILDPGSEILTRSMNVETAVSGKGVKAVRFLLDGRDMGRADKAPHQLKIKLPRGPKIMNLEAEALDENSQVLARDHITLNKGPYAFSIRITSPLNGGQYGKAARAEVQVKTPKDESLRRLDFYLNSEKIATLRHPPYILPLNLENEQGACDLSVIGTTDRGSTARDSVLFNAPGFLETLEVRQIELWASVYDKNRKPVLTLSREDFTVFEDGKKKEIEHFELANDLPLHLTFLTDISGSMAPYVSEIVQGSRRMINANIGKNDRASIMYFLDKPTLVTPFTSNRRALNKGLDQMLSTPIQASLGSGVNDSIAFALHQLGGIKGRRALLVFTDGMDNRSEYQPAEFAHFARQSQIRLYIIAGNRYDQRNNGLALLARQTGGGLYMAGDPGRLSEILTLIEGELRSQYRLAYNTEPPEKSGDCRKIKVKLKPKKLKVQTMQYYCH